MHIFIVQPQCVPCPLVSSVRWEPSDVVNDGRGRIKEGERPFLSSLYLVLLGAIMVVMKAHLSPSQPNLIILNEIAGSSGTSAAVCVFVEGGWADHACVCL